MHAAVCLKTNSNFHFKLEWENKHRVSSFSKPPDFQITELVNIGISEFLAISVRKATQKSEKK